MCRAAGAAEAGHAGLRYCGRALRLRLLRLLRLLRRPRGPRDPRRCCCGCRVGPAHSDEATQDAEHVAPFGSAAAKEQPAQKTAGVNASAPCSMHGGAPGGQHTTRSDPHLAPF